MLSQSHRGDDPFVISHLRPEINPAHRLDQYVKTSFMPAWRQKQGGVGRAPVQHADGLAIEEDKAKIVNARRPERKRPAGREGRAIEDATVALAVRFHGPGPGDLGRGWQVVE